MQDPRGFKTHSSPGHFLTFRDDVKYLVVARSPEDSLASFKIFLEMHSDEAFSLWETSMGIPAGVLKKNMTRPTLDAFVKEVVLSFRPGGPSAPELPGGMITAFFASFLNSWWPLRHKPNVHFVHFSELKKDHAGSIRNIADFLGFQPTNEQWPRILEYTSFPWMKANESKFEEVMCGKDLDIPVLKSGAMVFNSFIYIHIYI